MSSNSLPAPLPPSQQRPQAGVTLPGHEARQTRSADAEETHNHDRRLDALKLAVQATELTSAAQANDDAILSRADSFLNWLKGKKANGTNI